MIEHEKLGCFILQLARAAYISTYEQITANALYGARHTRYRMYGCGELHNDVSESHGQFSETGMVAVCQDHYGRPVARESYETSPVADVVTTLAEEC